MKRAIFTLLFLFLPVLAFAQEATNSTAPLPDLEQDPGSFFEITYHAVSSGKWIVVAGAALMVVVWVLRKFIANLIPFFGTDRGGVVLVILTSLLGGVGNALAAGHGFDMTLVKAIVTTTLAAIGGWVGIRKLLGVSNAQKEGGA